MINSLTMVNVRRHADTHIDFSGDGQLIALAGSNGAGKSTILEALLYALYGETRHGRSGIAGMVRRGAEHEGMQVTLTFTLDSVSYEVVRRYEKGKSTASLSVNGKETMRSVAGVSAEIGRILGMDAAGFKLATIAKQKELDGLAELTPAKRRAAVARLLRLDAVQTAAKNAREEYVRNKDIATALSAQSDTQAAQGRLDDVQRRYDEAKGALEDARAQVDSIAAKLRESRDVEEKWAASQRAQDAANASVESSLAQVSSIEVQMASVFVPAEPAPGRTIEDIDKQLTQVANSIATGEAAAQAARSRARLESDLAACTEQVSLVEEELAGLEGAQERLLDAQEALAQAQVDLEAASAAANEASTALARAKSEMDHAQRRVNGLDNLGATCSTCEQSIDPEHQHRQLDQARSELDLASENVASSTARRGEAVAAVEGLRDQVHASSQACESARDSVTRQGTQRERLEDLLRSLDTYTTTLERIPEEDADLERHYQDKAVLEAERGTAAERDRQVSARQTALARMETLTESLTSARARLEAAENELAAAVPNEELVLAWKARKELTERYEGESELLAGMSDLVSNCSGEVRAAKAALDSAQALGEQASEHRSKALVASKAHEVLSAVARTLSTEIRPALQAEVSSLLETLSEGRFTSVQISEDYDVTVEDDDGQYHPVSEFSGGEADLIALAIRLALAQIVARRHGAGSTGFLILDEVLGSQDEARRLAILEGLRRLRRIYGQILLISHVGGMEDAADRVISLETVDGVCSAS